MKNLLLISALALVAASCSNGKTEAQEEHQRDSVDNVQLDANQRLVDSLERADEARQQQQKDSTSHEGHDHSGHEGHSH